MSRKRWKEFYRQLRKARRDFLPVGYIQNDKWRYEFHGYAGAFTFKDGA